MSFPSRPRHASKRVRPRRHSVKGYQVIAYWQKSIHRLLRDEDGPTAVEYAVILALIVGVCISAVQAMSVAARDSFDTSSNAIQDAIS